MFSSSSLTVSLKIFFFSLNRIYQFTLRSDMCIYIHTPSQIATSCPNAIYKKAIYPTPTCVRPIENSGPVCDFYPAFLTGRPLMSYPPPPKPNSALLSTEITSWPTAQTRNLSLTTSSQPTDKARAVPQSNTCRAPGCASAQASRATQPQPGGCLNSLLPHLRSGSPPRHSPTPTLH